MRDKILYVLGVAAFLILARDIYMIARFPPEASQGNAFKIIFFHLAAWGSAGATLTAALVTSVLFLATKNFKYDAA
ncbi:MAG TPA: hypothetical protein VH640_12165, partial [Bryobacteraceae bacterium]